MFQLKTGPFIGIFDQMMRIFQSATLGGGGVSYFIWVLHSIGNKNRETKKFFHSSCFLHKTIKSRNIFGNGANCSVVNFVLDRFCS